eukprot:GHUV01042829.1.p1 GENE.GHUV01042829.1~~GHUV01042829.1.p1  ORF type:complete len:180 (-),score=34.92 GHUV01042829.1:46-585(-)
MRGLALPGQHRSLQSAAQRLRSSSCSIVRPLRAIHRPCRPSRASSRQTSRGAIQVVASLDYIATASDEGVLKLPARTELDPEEIKNVFAYPRCEVKAALQTLQHGVSLLWVPATLQAAAANVQADSRVLRARRQLPAAARAKGHAYAFAMHSSSLVTVPSVWLRSFSNVNRHRRIVRSA